MATKSDPDLIDDLLRQDEAELRAKKKRLRAFQTALDELRRASETVASAGAALVAAGDISRAEASKVFNLSKGERAAAFPARPRSESSVADSVNEPTHPVDDPSDESDEQHTDLGQ
jgi:type II secretory pathway pseudopilin PulG